MTEIKNQLQEAKKEFEIYEEKTKSLKSLREKISEEEKKIKEHDNVKQKAIDDAMKEKKNELDSQYNAIVVSLTNKINEAKDKKKAEIKKNKEQRIETETKENKENIVLFKNQIAELLENNKISKIAGTDFYFTFFRAISFKRVLIAVAIFILLLIGLPLLIANIMFGNQMFVGVINTLKVIAVFVVNIFVWAAIWLLISHFTEMPEDVYLKLKNLKLNIEDNKEQIRILSRSIMNDNDESKFDYTEVDREIELANLDLQSAKEQNEKDVKFLNTVVHDQIVAKIEEEAKSEYDSLKMEYDKDKAQFSVLSDELDNMNKQLTEKYETLVGKENMTTEKIDKLISVFENNSEQDLLLKQAREMAKKK